MKTQYSFITVPVLIIVLKIIVSSFPEQHGTLAKKWDKQEQVAYFKNFGKIFKNCFLW